MPVGHGGDMSKHPAWVKIAILEFLEARLKDVVDALTINDDNKYEAALDWFKRYLGEISEKPDDYMTKFKKLYDENTSISIGPDIRYIFSATLSTTSEANARVKVYDPFTTEMDFYLFLDVNWDRYLLIYSKYYDLDFKGFRQVLWEIKYSDDDYILDLVLGENRDQVFNATRSKSVIFYTIQQMKNILTLGHP
jgi:hypothetical protein